MSKFFDPVPIVEEKFAKLRGVVTIGGEHDAVGACKFRGETVTATILGPTLAIGDSVSVVKIESGNYMMAASGDYHSTARIELSEWAKKFPANLALRMLMDDNPKDYLYRKARVTSYNSTAKTAIVGEPYSCTLPVKFGTVDGSISAGPCLVCEVENTSRHVIGQTAPSETMCRVSYGHPGYWWVYGPADGFNIRLAENKWTQFYGAYNDGHALATVDYQFQLFTLSAISGTLPAGTYSLRFNEDWLLSVYSKIPLPAPYSGWTQANFYREFHPAEFGAFTPERTIGAGGSSLSWSGGDIGTDIPFDTIVMEIKYVPA